MDNSASNSGKNSNDKTDNPNPDSFPKRSRKSGNGEGSGKKKDMKGINNFYNYTFCFIHCLTRAGVTRYWTTHDHVTNFKIANFRHEAKTFEKRSF